MPKENYHGGLQSLDPFYPDGYISTDQDRQQIIAQKQGYAASDEKPTQFGSTVASYLGFNRELMDRMNYGS